jgi:hypothetical protein
MIQQRRAQQHQSQHLFKASEVAEFEYCPLSWWHERYAPLSRADTEDLFAHLVELEHEHGQQAIALPEYQVAEQLLLRRGAFGEGQQQHLEHSDEVAALEEEPLPPTSTIQRRLVNVALLLLGLALLLLVLAFVLLFR